MKLRISLEGQSYDVEVEILPDAPESCDSEAMAYPESVLRPPVPNDARPEDKICRSPIAGVIVSVAAFVRQKVSQDDPVAVIEAMKMQTTIGAPVDGVIDVVHVIPGQLVKPGQPLCTIL